MDTRPIMRSPPQQARPPPIRRQQNRAAFEEELEEVSMPLIREIIIGRLSIEEFHRLMDDALERYRRRIERGGGFTLFRLYNMKS